jgi:Phage integrase family/Helix-turn-helix domain
MAAARKSSRYGHRDATMILIGYRHGLRASELCDLQWSQVELATGRLHVRRAKNGSPSVHPMQGDEIRELRRLQREQAGAGSVQGLLADVKMDAMMMIAFAFGCNPDPGEHRRGSAALMKYSTPHPLGGCRGKATPLDDGPTVSVPIEADIDAEIGARLAEVRRRCGLTQRQLAKAVGVALTAVQNWERGLRSPAGWPSAGRG